jgi:hypothetical protein
MKEPYRVDFKGFSYGFRPGRSPHQALDALTVGVQRKRVNWVLDADIRGFFDNLSHEWTMKFIEHRVADRRILRPDPEMAEGGSIGRRPVVSSGPEAAGRGKTRDLYLPGLYPLLWATPQERNLHRMADYCEKANGCETQSHQG